MALSNDAICQLFVSDQPRYALNNSGSMRIITRGEGIWELTTYGVTLAIRDHTVDEVPRIYINPAQYSPTSSKQRSCLYAALSWRGPRVWEQSGSNRTMYCDRWGERGGKDLPWSEFIPTTTRRLSYQEAKEMGHEYPFDASVELEPLRVREGVPA